MKRLKGLPIWAMVALMMNMPAGSTAQTLSVDDMATRMNRQTITGATIITHGYQLWDSDGDSLMPLADAIKKKIQARFDNEGNGERCWLLDLDIVGGSNPIIGRDGGDTVFDLAQSTAPADSDTGVRGHVIILFDWAAESNERNHGWTEAAGDALFALLIKLGIVNIQHGTNAPMHFIAHSFGCAATSECVERLAHYNITVDHVTYLDPHDFSQPVRDVTGQIPVDTAQRQWTVGKPNGYGASVWNNVIFADCYYQTRGASGSSDFFANLPNGRPIPGAYNYFVNIHLPRSSAYSFSNSDHTYVWNAFYRGTVLGRLPNDNDYPGASECPPPIVAPDWGNTGWAYSRFSNSGVGRPASCFYVDGGNAQDHRYSEADLVNRSTGQPNLTGLRSRGLNATHIDAGRWYPRWNRWEIVNGNFNATGSRQVADIIPGWSHHGGGGDGDADDPGILTLNWNDDDRTHNRLFIPPNATHLEFQAKRTDDGDDTVRVYIGNTLIWSLAMDSTDQRFFTYRVLVPPSMRGTVDTINLTLSDDPGGWNSWVSSEIKFDNLKWVIANNPPRAVNDHYRILRNQQLIVAEPGVLRNDYDPDRQVIWVARVTRYPRHGTLIALETGGRLVYQPNAGFVGQDELRYVVTDGQLESQEAVVKINVEPPPNNAPVALSDHYAVSRKQPLLVFAPGVRENDYDLDGDLLVAQLLTLPVYGVLIYFDDDGSFLYLPDENFMGVDTFYYWVTDGTDVSEPTEVTVATVNTAPMGQNDQYTIPSFAPIRVPAPGVLKNDSDPENDSFTAVLHTQATAGTVALHMDGSFDYTPPPGGAGQATFTYLVVDSSGLASSPVTVTIDYFDYYLLTDLGIPPGASNSNAQRINDLGQVVGNTSNPSVGFLWDDCGMTDMGGNFASMTPFGINNAGLVCGSARQTGGPLRAFAWYDGSFIDLGTFGGASSEAYGMNEFSEIVGWAELPDGTAHAALWSNGRMIDLGKPGATLSSSAADINHRGQIAGQSVSAITGHLQAFRWENGEFTMLGTIPGFMLGSYSGGINDAGQICGTSYGYPDDSNAQAFMWYNGYLTGLGNLYGLSSYSRQINNLGQIVGRLGNGPQRRAFLYQGGTMVDLNNLIRPGTGWTLMVARDINDAGQIVGLGMRGGVQRAFLLTPQNFVSHCLPGDVNCDGCVDDADLLEVLFAFGSTGDCLRADLNKDGIVDDSDLLIVLFNFGNGC